MCRLGIYIAQGRFTRTRGDISLFVIQMDCILSIRIFKFFLYETHVLEKIFVYETAFKYSNFHI